MKSSKTLKGLLSLVLVSFMSIGGCNSSTFTDEPIIDVSHEFPEDIEGEAPNASLLEAAAFAWHEFIALSWPADPEKRDTPDVNRLFGEPGYEGPLVWETFRHKVEIYPGTGDNPPGFIDDPEASYGYDSPPVYLYGDGEVLPCAGQEVPDTTPFVNLDELTQIGLNFMFAGAAPSESLTNNDPKLIRFMAKANRVHYEYVVDPATSFWKHSEAYKEAVSNFQMVAQGNGTPSTLPGPVIDFPPGMVEIKTAFRELTDEELNSGRFHTTRVRYYEQDESDPNSACYIEDVWGLVGLHIIHKTESAPYFIFATFEQADNILTKDGLPVEDTAGTIINSSGLAPTTPDLVYIDGNPPSLNIVGDEFCNDIGQRLYYQEVGPDLFGTESGLPFGGDICQNERTHPIPFPIIRANEIAHEAIANYNSTNGIEDSPWLYYRLSDVQYVPFDKTEINPDPDSDRNESTYYLNNIVIETDYSLQTFSGRLFASDPAGPPTDLPANFNNFDSSRQTFQNVLLFDNQGNLERTYNMGGCMGCHGNAQLGGTDFSFILANGPTVDGPEATGVTTPGATNPAFPFDD